MTDKQKQELIELLQAAIEMADAAHIWDERRDKLCALLQVLKDEKK